MAHDDTPYLTEGYRFNKAIHGQASFDFGVPLGFIESSYSPERGALFFASAWIEDKTVNYLVRDTPDKWLHIGWSASAEYRTNGRWRSIADAPDDVLQHFRESAHEHANLRGRWSLTGGSSTPGFSIAHELCGAALDWWDDQIELNPELIFSPQSPQIHDFCAVFPTLSARRLPYGPSWNIIYSTETAEWIYDAKKKWVFHKEIGIRDRVTTANMKWRLAEPWAQYRRTLASFPAGSRHNPDGKRLTAIAELFQHGTEFPLISALLPELLNEASSKNMNFGDLSRYSAVNAIASNSKYEDPNRNQFFVQNDVARWERSRSRWSAVDRKPISRGTEEMSLDDLSRRVLQLNADPNQNALGFEESPRTWIISNINSSLSSDLPIHDVVRGNIDASGTGWRLAWGNPFQWSWTSIPELNIEHMMPMYEFDPNSYAETHCIEVEEKLEVSLEEFWTDVISSEIKYDGYPTWLDFLEWVRDYS